MQSPMAGAAEEELMTNLKQVNLLSSHPSDARGGNSNNDYDNNIVEGMEGEAKMGSINFE
eukprot:CAMPEP_0171351006 /NCGR_PEP_ID=MMETSP0878-20121228/37880_1 /TAXON_ID=67004 /ORGANISM="Thalassiosira weissflogii, Strain CCMP1336" /LENGTH=59 /DNA_ID=CAMNT_0011856117 /DNA_START=120 /DNA_END=299 /DNA_ORIENTATION=-